jgi:hypothetical protein
MRRFARAVAARSPFVSTTWGRWRTARELVEMRLRSMAGPRDVFLVSGRTISVPPRCIRRRARPDRYRTRRHLVPPVIPGDWDVTGILLDNSGLYDDLRAVAAGAKWETTCVYARAMASLERGEAAWHESASREEFEQKWCAGWDRLLESIESDGYRSQAELCKTRSRDVDRRLSDEVTVAIGRDGSFLVWEGAHRVACATVLGVEVIPARVVFRHPEWAAFRHKLERYAGGNGGMVREPLLHPDLDNIPSSRDCSSEFEQISRTIGTQLGSVVDLTPGWGYYCQRLEHVGFDCTAIVDPGDDEQFLRVLRVANESAFTVVMTTDFHPPQSFDVALALDWTRSGLDPSRGWERLLKLIEALDATTLMLEVPRTPFQSGHPPVGAGMLASVVEKCGFSEWSLVGTRAPQTELFRLSRTRSMPPDQLAQVI